VVSRVASVTLGGRGNLADLAAAHGGARLWARAAAGDRDPGNGKAAPPALLRRGVGQRRPPGAGRTVKHQHTAGARRRPVQQHAYRRQFPLTPNQAHN
jgi:hypothetical protein